MADLIRIEARKERIQVAYRAQETNAEAHILSRTSSADLTFSFPFHYRHPGYHGRHDLAHGRAHDHERRFC